MPEPTTPFDGMHAEYAWRLFASILCVMLAAAAARLLYAGALPQYWVVELVTVCLAASVGTMLSLDVLQRYIQLRQLRMVENRSNPYSVSGVVPPSEASTNFATPSARRKPTSH